jgi:hypothetical protein
MVKHLSAYNNSMFKLRFEYPNVFSKLWDKEEETRLLEFKTGEKPYVRECKIIY